MCATSSTPNARQRAVPYFTTAWKSSPCHGIALEEARIDFNSSRLPPRMTGTLLAYLPVANESNPSIGITVPSFSTSGLAMIPPLGEP